MKTMTTSRSHDASLEGSLMTLRSFGARALFMMAAFGLAALGPFGGGVARGQAAASPALPAPHAPAPQIESDGGPVLATPLVVPVLYASDPLVVPLTDYFAKLGASGYLTQALAEYGVESVTIAPPVVLSDPPPASIGDFDMFYWLGGLIDAGTLPPADGNTTFHVVFPSTTQVITGQLYGEPKPTCAPGQFETYSSAGGIAGFSYVPRCEGSTFGMSDLDYETVRGAAAIADTIVNPFPFELPGQGLGDASWHGSGWASLNANTIYDIYGLGEMCLATAHEATLKPASIGYQVPRIWSNQGAATGHDMCRDPAAHGAYFNAAPDIAGGTEFAIYNMVKGLALPPGGRVTIPVRLFSDEPTGEWTLSAIERTDLAPDPDGVLSFSFDRARGRNGDVRLLTIERAATSDGSVAQNLVFDIVSTDSHATHEWLVIVGNE
jgi:hypothetical protein